MINASKSKDAMLLSDSFISEIHGANRSVQPLIKYVSKESIHQKHLATAFGERYIEGQSKPRLFAVKLWFHKLEQKPGYVVFKVSQEKNIICSDDIDNSGLVEVRVQVRCDLPDEQILMMLQKLDEHFSCDESTPTVQQIIAFIQDCLDAKSSPDEPVQSSKGRPFSSLSEICGWSVESYDKDDALRIVQNEPVILQTVVAEQSVVKSAAPKDVVPDNLACDICFEPCSSHMMGCALQSCDHWFCSECWCSHLESRVMEGDLQLKCPDHSCNSVIDMTTILSLIPYSLFLKHQLRVNNVKLELSPHWKWCQGLQGRCNKIIRVTSTHTVDSCEGEADLHYMFMQVNMVFGLWQGTSLASNM